MGERLTWEEIVKKYPDKWVILDAEFDDDGLLIGGSVIEICTDDTIDDALIKWDEAGKSNYMRVRTTEEPFFTYREVGGI